MAKKSMGTANPLLFFLGIFGAHDFYLGNIGRGILRICLFTIGIPCYIGGIIYLDTTSSESVGIVLLIVGALCWFITLALNIVDVFTLHDRVNNYNRKLRGDNRLRAEHRLPK